MGLLSLPSHPLLSTPTQAHSFGVSNVSRASELYLLAPFVRSPLREKKAFSFLKSGLINVVNN